MDVRKRKDGTLFTDGLLLKEFSVRKGKPFRMQIDLPAFSWATSVEFSSPGNANT
jgi:hypothetical protein